MDYYKFRQTDILIVYAHAHLDGRLMIRDVPERISTDWEKYRMIMCWQCHESQIAGASVLTGN